MKTIPSINGLGFICSIGNNRGDVLESLQQDRSGLGPFPHTWSTDSPVRMAGTLEGFQCATTNPIDWTVPAPFSIPRELGRTIAPHLLFAYWALQEALQDAGIEPASLTLKNAGLYAASAGSPLLLHHHVSHMQESRGSRINPSGVLSSISGTLNFSLGALFGIQGGNCGFVSACTSSAHAIGYAIEDLLAERIDTAVIVAGEDLTAESLLPFAGMRALSTSEGAGASCPFDRNRDGFVPTGGAVAIILQSRPHSGTYALLRHWDHSSDGHDAAVSHPEGEGIFRALSRLTRRTGLHPEQMDYLNAHATSTVRGDRSEAIGIQRYLGKTPVPVSSTKGLTGHGLSMSGALEAGFCSLMMKHQFIAGNPNLENPDDCCETLNLPRNARAHPLKRILSNSCGFGGSNVCLLLESPQLADSP